MKSILVLGAGAWGTAIANLLAENIKEDVDESMDPIGYQAIVLDPNPKAVCQLLGIDKILFF